MSKLRLSGVHYDVNEGKGPYPVAACSEYVRGMFSCGRDIVTCPECRLELEWSPIETPPNPEHELRYRLMADASFRQAWDMATQAAIAMIREHAHNCEKKAESSRDDLALWRASGFHAAANYLAEGFHEPGHRGKS